VLVLEISPYDFLLNRARLHIPSFCDHFNIGKLYQTVKAREAEKVMLWYNAGAVSHWTHQIEDNGMPTAILGQMGSHGS
jgi:hypothetical protein